MINVKQFFAKLSDLPVTMVNFLATVQKRLLTPLSALFLQITGYTIFNLFDAFSVASLILIVFKLLLRLLGADPSYALNLSILLLGIIFSLKVNLIEFVREGLIKFWKKVLGERFYYYPNTFELAQLINNYSNLKEITIINKIFQELFYLFILIRLFILGEPYLFITGNLILTYFLIINKYLILSSLISIIIVFSKFTFYLTNYTTQDVEKVINPIVNLQEDETLKPTRENALFMAIIMIREFYLPDEERKLFLNNTCLSTYYLSELLEREKHPLIQKVQENTYYEGRPANFPVDFYLEYQVRYDFHNFENEFIKKNEKFSENEEKIFDKKRKNKHFGTAIVVLLFLFCFFYLSGSDNLIAQAFPKIIIIPKFVRIPINDTERAIITWQNPKNKFSFSKKIHPEYLKKENSIIYSNNESTFKNTSFSNLRKKAFPDILNKNNFKSIKPVNNEILSVVQTGESYSASIDADEFLSRYEEVTKEIQQIIEKNPNYINQDLLAKLRSCVKTKEEQHIINTYLTNRSAYSMHIQHDSVGFVKYALLDSRFRHKDIQVFMSSGRRYYKLALENGKLGNSQFLKEQFVLTQIQSKVFNDFCKVLERHYLDLDYSSDEHPQVAENMLFLSAINSAASANSTDLHLKTEMGVISSITKQNLEELSGDYSNGELIKSSVFT